MRKNQSIILVALLMVVFSISGAYAAQDDQFSVGEWRIDSSSTVKPSTSASAYAITESFSSAATKLLGTTDSGTVIADDIGAKFTLPTAAVGMTFTIVTQYTSAGSIVYSTVDTFDTSDTIQYSIGGTALDAGDSLLSTGDAGDSVTVTCVKANEWTIENMQGIWTDNSTN